MTLYDFKDHPDHQARLGEWADKWIANAMSTAPADQTAMRSAMAGLYDAANLEPPTRGVFVKSPMTAAIAGSIAAGVWWIRDNPGQHAELFGHVVSEAELLAALRVACAVAMDRGMAMLRGEEPRLSWPPDATEDATEDATWAATWDATRDATWAATWAATRGATWAATRAATRDATEDATRADLSNWYVVGADMRRLAQAMGLDGFGLQCAAHAWRMWQGGNQWSGYDSYLSFFRHIASLDIDYSAWQHWEDLSLNSGPRIMHPDFCMVSDRPETLLVDDRNRPHCDTGPFCRWRDGTALYSVHGVRVPAWLIERPGDLTAAKIDAETNAEVRRIMLDRFGAARWLTESGAKVVDEAPADHPLLGLRTARLLRRDVQDDEPILLVDLLNSTPEPDGSTKRYQIRVSPNEYGGESSKNVLAAVASTWRLPDGSLAFRTWRDYAPQVET